MKSAAAKRITLGDIITTTQPRPASYSGYMRLYPEQLFIPGMKGRVTDDDGKFFEVHFLGRVYGSVGHPYTIWRVWLPKKLTEFVEPGQLPNNWERLKLENVEEWLP